MPYSYRGALSLFMPYSYRGAFLCLIVIAALFMPRSYNWGAFLV